MASLNNVELIGYLGKDPEIRRTQDGRPIVNMRVATSEVWKDKQTGERREKTEWHTVVIFNEQMAKVAEEYLRSGMQVYIQGKLQTRKWQDNNGNDRYSTEVVCQWDCRLLMLGKQGDNQQPRQQQQPSNQGYGNNGGRSNNAYDAQRTAQDQHERKLAQEMDDNIPF